jgi:hypothetical protein
VGVAVAPLALGSSSLDLAGTNPDRSTGKQGGELTFKFQLVQDLWKHDVFEISVSQYWTISNDISCRSEQISNLVNHVNGTDSTRPHYMNCVYTGALSATNKKVYVYGLGNDVDISAGKEYESVDLRIGPVTNPTVDYTSATYVW